MAETNEGPACAKFGLYPNGLIFSCFFFVFFARCHSIMMLRKEQNQGTFDIMLNFLDQAAGKQTSALVVLV